MLPPLLVGCSDRELLEPVAKGLAAGAEGWVDPPKPPKPLVDGVVLKDGCDEPPPKPAENDGVPPKPEVVELEPNPGVEGAPNPGVPKPDDEGAEGWVGVEGKAGKAVVVDGVEDPNGVEGWFDPKTGPALGADGVVVKPEKPVLGVDGVVD